jgi:short-chain 2-methylacyl-CoA dehydrogenase
VESLQPNQPTGDCGPEPPSNPARFTATPVSVRIPEQLRTLIGGRIAIAALSVGVGQACLDASLQHATTRKAFGQHIAEFQAIQFKLADMATEVELGRLITYRAATAYMARGGNDPEVRKLAAMAKLHASETSKRAADQAVQIHGGYGFMDDSLVARYYRDVKINEIGEGTSEVQRMLIARELLAGPLRSR